MPSVKVFAMTFDFLNEERTFSEGDIISGEVTLNLEKDNKVESLFVKATGDANVRWSEKRGDKTHTYSDHRRYFKVKEFLIPENNKDTMIPKGVNVYKFALKIPSGSLPSSFKGLHGKIVYKLEAKLSRSWKMDRQVVNELNFASRAAYMSNLGHLMTRSVGSTDKAMTFSKGQVHMDAVLEKLIYAPGETVAVVVKVNNSSSKSMTPKLKLIHKIVYSAHASTKYEEHTICKLVGDVIETTTEQTVNFALKLPTDLTPAIQNCDIISVQYQLKVYLDISFSFDPEVTFLLVIAPVGFTSGRPEQYPPVAFGRPFVPPSASTVPGFGYPEQPPVYPPFALMPSVQPAAAAVHNPMPPRVSPYGSPFSSSSSSPVHHPPPTGPFPPPPPAPVFNPTPPPPAFNPTPPAPVFYPTPPAPAFNPTPSAPPLFGQSSTAPTFNLPSAPMMNTDFLSQQDEEPPSYLSMFPPSTPYKKETPD